MPDKPVREQVELELEGVKYRVVPDMMTLEMIEQKLSPIQLIHKLQQYDIRFSEIAWIYFSALQCQGITAYPSHYELMDVVRQDLPRHIEQASNIVNVMMSAGPERPVPQEGKQNTGKSKKKGSSQASTEQP